MMAYRLLFLLVRPNYSPLLSRHGTSGDTVNLAKMNKFKVTY